MNKQPIQLRKIRDFGQCIGDALAFLKEHFKPLVGSTLAIAGIFLALEMVSLYIHLSGVFLKASEDGYGGLRSMSNTYTTTHLVSFITTMLAYMVIVCSVNAYVAVYLENSHKKPTLAEVWSYLTYYFWRVTGGLLLSYFVLILGFLLCVVPGIWLIPISSLIIPVIIIENSGFNYAMDRSIKLVKDNWWFTFGVIFVSGIIAMIPGYFVGIIIALVGGASVYFSTGQVGSSFGLGLSLIQVFLQILYIFPVLAATICYLSLVEEKEGVGMMDRIAAFGEKKEEENGYSGDYEEQY